MRIQSFQAKRLHGYLDIKLTFFSDLTFLTGINGSGKTSAVRALMALLGPSFAELAALQFETLRAFVAYDNQSVEITAERIDDEVSLRHSSASGVLRFPVLKATAFESAISFREKQRAFYQEQEALLRKHEVLAAIERLPTPMFLDLDRKNQDGSRLRTSPSRYMSRNRSSDPLSGSLSDSLLDAEALAEFSYRDFHATRTSLTDALKQDIILTAFRPSSSGFFFGLSADVPDATTVSKNESLVRHSLTDIGISAARQNEVVDPFFERLRSVISEVPTEEEMSKGDFLSDPELFRRYTEWSALQPQVAQIATLVDFINKYNLQAREAYEPIRRYLDIVNRFFADSGKSISFDPAGNLRIVVSEAKHFRPVRELSSGERQLIVILTHLAFNRIARRANILIIDEPELSLHLRWQELFVSAVLEANSDMQLIFATHSPSIIGERLQHCIDVESENPDARLFN